MRSFHIVLAALISSAPAFAQQAAEPAWVLAQEGGTEIATYAPPGGSPLLSVGCDQAKGEIVVFRAVANPAQEPVLTLVAETGSLRLEATPDPAGTPGVIARAQADNAFVAALAAAATITFRVSGEEAAQSGIAAPMADPLRNVIESCGR